MQPHCDEIADVSNLHDELLHNTLNDVIEVPSNAVTDSLTWNIVENLAALVGDSAVPFELLYPSGQHDGELRFGTDDDPSPVAPVTAASDEASASNSSALAATGNSSGAKRRVRQKKKSTKRGQHSGNGSNDLDRVATSEARQAANGPVNVSNHSTSTGAHCPSTGETVTVERVNHRARQQSSRQFPVNRVVNSGNHRDDTRRRVMNDHTTATSRLAYNGERRSAAGRFPSNRTNRTATTEHVSSSLRVSDSSGTARNIENRSNRSVHIPGPVNTGARQISTRPTCGSAQYQSVRQQGFPNFSTTVQQPTNNSQQYPQSHLNYRVRWQFEESLINRILQALRLQH